VATNKYEESRFGGCLRSNQSRPRALQNAASVASLMLTTEVLIAERTKDDSETAGAGARGDMGGMGM